jgi:hypothetical protein
VAFTHTLTAINHSNFNKFMFHVTKCEWGAYILGSLYLSFFSSFFLIKPSFRGSNQGKLGEHGDENLRTEKSEKQTNEKYTKRAGESVCERKKERENCYDGKEITKVTHIEWNIVSWEKCQNGKKSYQSYDVLIQSPNNFRLKASHECEEQSDDAQFMNLF